MISPSLQLELASEPQAELSSFLLALALARALSDVADIEATPPRLSTYESLTRRAEIASKGYVLKPEQTVFTGRPLALASVTTSSWWRDASSRSLPLVETQLCSTSDSDSDGHSDGAVYSNSLDDA